MDGAHPTVDVLLATWHGERFLREQLDSLLAQSGMPFTIVVGDDGSIDGTLAILNDYDRAHPGRFLLLPRPSERLGPRANFARLIAASDADYMFFCDQDDIWLPGKMVATLATIRRLEGRYGTTMPCLVHTDLTVIDACGRVLGTSFFDYAGIKPRLHSMMSLLTANVATGCTSVINRALRDRMLPIPPAALMHDHWAAQVAATIGVIDYLDRSTILYRQHDGNSLGAQRAGAAGFLHNLRETLIGHRNLSVMDRYVAAAGALVERVGAGLDPRRHALLTAFAGLKRQRAPMRLLTLTRYRIHKRERILATVAMYILAFRLRRDTDHRQ